MASMKETLKSIESALKLIDTKKDNLKQAYDDLHCRFPISLSWSDIDSHFTALHNDLSQRLLLLQNYTPPSNNASADKTQIGFGENRSKLESFESPSQNTVDSAVSLSFCAQAVRHAESVVKWKELVGFCERMDGVGLREFVSDHAEERIAMRGELLCALRGARDLGRMILDAMEGFCESDSDGSRVLKNGCAYLFEVLVEIRPVLRDEVKERAKKIALLWQQRLSSGREPFDFLKFVAAYRLQNEFNVDELVDYSASLRKFNHAKVLVEALGLGHRVTDLIKKMIEKAKQPLAVQLIYEFGLTDKFQPVCILKDYVKDCRQFAQKCEEEKKSAIVVSDARSREINALRSVLKIIDEYKIASEYPRVEIVKRLRILEKEKLSNKNPATSADKKLQAAQRPVNPEQSNGQKKSLKKRLAQQMKHQQDGNKRQCESGPSVPSASMSNLVVPPYQHSRVVAVGGLPGLVGPTLPIAPYAITVPGDPSHNLVPVYTSEPYFPHRYGDAAGAYGGYGYPPQHHPTYHPQ